MTQVRAYLRLLRPKEYLKNFFVLLPVFFGGGLTDPDRVLGALSAFFVFCLAASTVSIMNDVLNHNEDRNHPVKCAQASMPPRWRPFWATAGRTPKRTSLALTPFATNTSPGSGKCEVSYKFYLLKETSFAEYA